MTNNEKADIRFIKQLHHDGMELQDMLNEFQRSGFMSCYHKIYDLIYKLNEEKAIKEEAYSKFISQLEIIRMCQEFSNK